jgi:type I restriction enzyme S subunit
MKAIPVQLPPVDEQHQILDWIKVHLQPLLSSIARARRGIDLISEYRTQLIADVITGKLDVRDMEIPTLDDFDGSHDVAELAEQLGEVEVIEEEDAG